MNEKTVSQILEEIAQSICDTRCKYPHEWDEDKEGIPLDESEICENCPLMRL